VKYNIPLSIFISSLFSKGRKHRGWRNRTKRITQLINTVYKDYYGNQEDFSETDVTEAFMS